MTDERMSGWALIVASVAGVVTMALHPTGHVPAAEMEGMLRMLIMVHSLALAWMPIQFLGAWGLARHIAKPDRFANSGLVIYAMSMMALVNAAVADGLVAPVVFRQIAASAGSQPAVDAWRMISHYNFFVNQAFAQVFVATSSAAIVLWSVSLLRSGMMSRGLAVYGCILGVAAVVAMASGHLRLTAHGFGAVVLGQAIWFVVAGAILLLSQTAVKQAVA